MDFKDLLRTARRRWKTIVALLLIALVAAGAYSFLVTPKYESNARVFISTDVEDSSEAIAASLVSSGRVSSYADLATSREIMEKVIGELNLEESPSELADMIKAEVEPLTVIIDITVNHPDPKIAQAIAQSEAEQLTKYITRIDAPNRAATPIRATVADPASYNAEPVSPRTLLNLAVAGLIGLVIGCGVAVLREITDNTVKTAEDIRKITETGVVANIGFDSDVPTHPLLTDLNGFAPRAEAFRVLRTNLDYLDLDAQPKSFVITSALPGEGKTTTSTNLAIALAQAGRRVLLVDGDLRRPRVAGLLGLEGKVGLTTVLVGKSSLVDSIQQHGDTGVDFLGGGPIPPNPTEVLQSNATRDLIRKMRDMYDVVIIDAPPLLPVADAAILARAADGALMVIRHGKTTKEQLHDACQRIDQVDARLYGVVVNMAPRRGQQDYYYYYADETDPAIKSGRWVSLKP
ncbi:polysaccharide biosynthesis tyrosine autokinase [Nocardioides sp. JQ2195]|uniref:polysaccharide biosynthesis tyrosine autokinase n=1 Tax=Nocardioides sp. JQ2195 TaxID=2592334 RepID=UPI00143E3F50|nr:polysaccharide biosynthesis tyrosine autokinase [Nocardioides sp. JQ2195]QIX25503.1 polysaccharide biosynthesis tyrosine autokinase [Nocardioides sp. JQ2195]